MDRRNHSNSPVTCFLLLDVLTCICRAQSGEPPQSAAPAILHWSSNGLKLSIFKNEIKKAYFLNDPEQTSLPITVAGNTQIVQTPHDAPNAMASVIVVEFVGEPVEK